MITANGVAFEQLCDITKRIREEGKTVVHCHGVFDLLHIGHIRHLQAAKRHGECLVVTITPDRFVNKGPGRPAFSEALRAEALASLECVDYVAINPWPIAVETIKALKPHVYAKGSDYKNPAEDITGGISLEEQATKEVGAKLVFTDEITSSSSKLINRFLPTFPEEMQQFLGGFRKKFTIDTIHTLFEAMKDLKVCVVGETILDDYHYCKCLGKAGKEPVLVAQHENQELFAGGILAVANHVAQLTSDVDVITLIGEKDSHEAFIRKSLVSGVTPHLLPMRGARTIVKRRFVESYPLQKLFEVYLMDEPQEHPQLLEELAQRIDQYDVVIVVDYGHGMLNRKCRELICKKAKFLAVNTQINAGNQGFNTVSKYPKADCICLSEKELRMDARQTKAPLDELMRKGSAALQASHLVITRGSEGIYGYHTSQGHCEVPAFGGGSVDRVGAGDAVLSISSLLAKLGAPMDVIGLVGNAAGYQAVQSIGNRAPISREQLIKFFEHVMK